VTDAPAQLTATESAPEAVPGPAIAPAEAALALSAVTVRAGGATLLSDVTWTVAPQERWVVLGANGAGKTTLLRLAAGRLFPTSGQVHLLGEVLGQTDLTQLRPRIGFASAALADAIPDGEAVLDAVVTAAWGVFGRFDEAYDPVDVERARSLLGRLGCRALEQRRFGTLSEGERKRVQLARALMTDPELLLLDEPAAGLDLGAREALLRLLGRLTADPDAPATVLVSHHVEEIPPGITHALLLRGGKVIASGPIADVLTARYLSVCFGFPLQVFADKGRFTARALV
jgi:iron complex transport system ATP-binding protein